MTDYVMNEFIITEGQLCKLIHGIDDALECHYFMKEIRSRPNHSPNLHTCVHKEIRNDVEFCHYYDSPTDPTAIRNATLDEIEIQIMKKEEWTRMELLAIIGYNRSPRDQFRGEP